MSEFKLSLVICGFAVALLMPATSAHGQSAYTYVSASGSDANNCMTPAAACATLQRAVDQALAGGVVQVLSRGNFFPVTITKAISIIADEASAGIIQNSTSSDTLASAVLINAGSNDVISLRGLMIDQRNVTNAHGITFVAGAALHVENCVIRRTFGNGRSGINFFPNSGAVELYVSNTTITDGGNSSSAAAAIMIKAGGDTGASIRSAIIDRVHMENYSSGLIVDGIVGSATVVVRDSVIVGNANAGVLATRPSGSAATTVDVTIRRTEIAYNTTGVAVTGANVNVRVGDSTITGNTNGFSFGNRANIISYQTNILAGNGTNGAPSITEAMK